MAESPWERLGIPRQHRTVCTPEAPEKARLAAARGLLPVAPRVQIGMLYVLLGDPSTEVRAAAAQSLEEMATQTLIDAIGQRTHPKILEYLAEIRVEQQDLMERIFDIRNANDRTILRIADHAELALIEVISRNQERLLLTPRVYLHLKRNPHCSPAQVDKMAAFLRMQRALPEELAEAPPPKPPPAPEPVRASAMEEVEAALLGKVSPSTYLDDSAMDDLEMFDLGPDLDPEDDGGIAGAQEVGVPGFSFDFEDDANDFGWEMLEEGGGQSDDDEDEFMNLEKRIQKLQVGKKIKLAYLGNGEARRLLIRDRNKMVACAVVKSGRMNEREVETAAGNRNLDTEVIREMCRNRDYMRKYRVKMLLANNPKTPVSVATGLLKFMQAKDLKDLSHNKNISSVIQTQAKRLVAMKKKKGK